MSDRGFQLPPDNRYTESILSITPEGRPVVESICGRCVLYEYSGMPIDMKMCLTCRFFQGDPDSGICLNEENKRQPPSGE